MKSAFALRWLATRRGQAPVERRHAAFLQVLLAAIALYILGDIGFFLRVASPGELFARPVLVFATAGNALTLLGALAGMLMIRRGRSAAGTRAFVAGTLAATLLTYLRVDVYELISDPMPLIALALAGMVLGRRGLWRGFLALAGICAVAGAAHMLWNASNRSGWGTAGLVLGTIGAYLLVTLILDRTIAALRDSLFESEARRRELEQLNRRLVREMTERERVQEQLLHAQRMEVLGRLASGVAHDFDNVINVIIGYAQRREALEGQGVAPLLKTLENIEAAARRALTVSRRILNFGRAEPRMPRRFDARQALVEAEPLLRSLFGHGIRLEGIAPGPPLWIEMDLDDLELALLNIAANARDAMQGHGVFRVRGERAPGQVVLTLSDTGPGIPAHLLERILEPFYTTKPAGKGTGLGLSVVRDIAAAAGGTVVAGNGEGGGAFIRLCLPEASDQPANR